MTISSRNTSQEEEGFVGDGNDCIAGCPAFCCKIYTVLITSLDARRIIDNIPCIDAGDFVEFYRGDMDTQDEFPKVLIRGEEYCLGIKASEHTGACVFQTDARTCRIHEFSPLVCQSYPWSLDSSENLITMDNALCSHAFLPRDPDRTKTAIRQCWKESDIYAEKVRAWNEVFGRDESRNKEDFLLFVEKND